ncbi:hypothetical protein HCN44_000783 [Aphidius gifuensis]|uniref:Uncharacterized protein n=1 Tax=Aphidius gifuensis TaxID=684658 RepID=A0A835CR81_APHGI|nr:hypothetical protein HCN44_000783 [Aphidius gifuensis]
MLYQNHVNKHDNNIDISTDMNNLNRNKRDTRCIPGKKPLTHLTKNAKESHTVSSLMNSLNQKTANIKYSNDPNIVLLLGLSGAGKTTLAQYLFGNNSNLLSVAKRNECNETTSDFYIKDIEKKIGNNALLSHTEYPDLKIDLETNTPVYDCPGFSDTRHPEYDISGAYFIKAVSDKAKALKFIFVVDYNSVITGANREEFITLARHATDMINNISKYKESIALIATKIKDDKPDYQRIRAIVVFLQDVRQTLSEMNQEPNVQSFIDILLTTSGPGNQDYTRIGLMPKFDTEGRLIDLPTVKDHKKSILTIIHNNIKFTKIDTTDVKPSISSNSVYYIDDLANEVTQQMWIHIEAVVQHVQLFYDDLIRNMKEKIHSFNHHDKSIVDIDLSQAKLFSTKLNTGLSVISDFTENIKSKTTLNEILKYIISSALISEVHLSQEIVSNISTQQKDLEFLHTLIHKPKNSFSLDQLIIFFENLKIHLTLLSNHFHNDVSDVTDQIKNTILSIEYNIMNEIQKNYTHLTKTIRNNKILFSLMNSGYSGLMKIRDVANGPNVTYKCINQIQETVQHFNFTNTNIKSVNHTFQYTSKLINQLNFLQTLNNQSPDRYSWKCTAEINRVISYFDDSSKWYRSLIHLNESLLECNILNNFSPNEINNMISKNDSGKTVQDTNFNFFLQKVYSSSIYNLEYWQNIKLDQSKLKSLRKISNFISKYQSMHENCSSNNSPINDNSILLSDLYTTEGFIHEILTTENQFYDLHDKISLMKTSYESLLNKLTRYFKKITTKPEHGENIKALQYVFAIAATKLYRLNHNFEGTSIDLDIIEYFTIVEEHIKEYNKALKEVNINKHEQEYRRGIDESVRTTNDFVENHLQSAIDENIEKLDENIGMMIDNLITQRGSVENEMKNLDKSRSMIEGQLILKTLFGTLQFVGSSLAILGPVGAVMDSIAGIRNTNATSLLPEINAMMPITKLPASVSKYIPKISEHLKNKGKILDKKLYLVEKEFEKFMKKDSTYDLEKIQKKFYESHLEINEMISEDEKIVDANDLKKLTKLEKDIMDLVENEKNALNNELLTVLQDYEKEIKKNSPYNVTSIDNLYMLNKRINELSVEGKKLIEKEQKELKKLKQKVDIIINNHKSVKLEANKLERIKISVLEEYEKEKNKGEINNPKSLNNLLTLRKSLEDLSINHARTLKEMKEVKEIEYKPRMKLLTFVQNTVIMDEAVFEVYSKTKNDQTIIKAVLKIDQAKIKELKKYEQSIYEILIPLIQRLASISSENNFDDQSYVELDIKNWKIKDTIIDVQKQVLDMTQEFDAQDQLFKCFIDKINYGIQTIIQMYDRIQDDMDRKILTNYIADISRNNKITNDSKINDDIDKLELVLKSNMILVKYDQAINAFKQYVFPYAESYPHEFSLMYKYNNLTDLIDKSIGRIKSLREKMMHPDTLLDSEHRSHLHLDFNNLSEKISTVEPYFTWSHELYKDQISKLLQGQEIMIRANIEQFDERNALMFNDIGVYFKLKNATMQAKFDKLMSNLHINMTHLGDSYYRCGSKTYIMSHFPLTFDHSVIPSSNKKFESGNIIYEILTKHPAILSPFTMWKLNLFDTDRFNFEQFTKYTNESIDLQLVGTGQFIYPVPPQCNSNNLEKHYKLSITP